MNESTLDFSKMHIMGILNTTPDSFYDGGKFFNNLNKALYHTEKMIKDGATIIDIGGESTRPGAKEIEVKKELDRVIPVIEAINKRFKIFISVDTSKPEVMKCAAEAGAHLINDVRSLSKQGALKAAIDSNLFVCLTHMNNNNPQTMQNNIQYFDVLKEINIFFNKVINKYIKLGGKKNRLILDPGFGFGKNIYHNYKILANLNKLHHFNIPIAVGISHKSMITKLLNSQKKSHSLAGSIICAVIAEIQGAKILRVHDVKETFEAMKTVKTLSLRNLLNYD